MDEVAGGLAAIAELMAALVSAVIELIVLTIELGLYLLELLIWGIAALIGKSRARPQRRRFERPRMFRGNSKRLIAYLLIFGGLGLFFGGRAAYHHFFTAEIQLRGTLGLQVQGVEVEWMGASGKTKRETFKSPARYLKHRWDELRIVDDAYQPQTIELTKHSQNVQLRSRLLEKFTEDSIEKVSTAAGDAIDQTHENFDSEKIRDFLKKKLSEKLKNDHAEDSP